MPVFILSEEALTPAEAAISTETGKEFLQRVILDDREHGKVISTIEAEAVMRKVMINGEWTEKVIQSAWSVAREKVDESKFYHIENAGFFTTNTNTKSTA